MTTPAQRERTQLRTKLFTGRQIRSKGRGGGDIDESDLLQMWPKYLDMERSAAKRTLSLPDVAAMLENQQTPVFNALQPRPLSEREVAVIRAWHSKAEEQQRKDLGDALAAAQSNIMVHTTTQADRVIQEVRREVPQAVQGIIAEELDKRIGPPPQGTMEEALADRKRLNQRIRQLRKEAEENAKPEEELFGDVKEPAATVSDNGRESAKKRPRIETPSGEEKQRRAQKRARPAETQSARGRWAKKREHECPLLAQQKARPQPGCPPLDTPSPGGRGAVVLSDSLPLRPDLPTTTSAIGSPGRTPTK